MNDDVKNFFNTKNFNFSKKDELFKIFLRLSKKKIIGGFDIGEALKSLAKNEVKPGGPYQDRGGNIDLGLNVIIAYFLSRQGVNLPNLNKLIEESIIKDDFSSRYFKKQELLLHIISLIYEGPHKNKLENHLKKYPQNYSILLPSQSKDGDNDKDHEFLRIIIKAADKRFAFLSKEFKEMALEQINKTIKANKDGQMSLMPYYFKKALGKKGEMFSDELIADLGLANIFFWTAFIIYDDFWDEDEKADPKILPIANLFARSYIQTFNNILGKDTGFPSFFQKLMDKLDEANHWETLYCRSKVINDKFYIPENIPDYKGYDKKFEPASGHILGCLALSLKLGFKIDSPQTKNLLSYFKNYLIAMQLNDDMHDWEEDFRRGHLSTVVVLMLRDWKDKYPDKKIIDLKKDLKKLQKLFWFKTIKEACQITLSYTKKSRLALAKIDYLENKEYLAKFINNSEKGAKDALEEQEKSINFLSSL